MCACNFFFQCMKFFLTCFPIYFKVEKGRNFNKYDFGWQCFSNATSLHTVVDYACSALKSINVILFSWSWTTLSDNVIFHLDSLNSYHHFFSRTFCPVECDKLNPLADTMGDGLLRRYTFLEWRGWLSLEMFVSVASLEFIIGMTTIQVLWVEYLLVCYRAPGILSWVLTGLL